MFFLYHMVDSLVVVPGKVNMENTKLLLPIFTGIEMINICEF